MPLNIRAVSQSSEVKFPGAAEDEYIRLRDVLGWSADMMLQLNSLAEEPNEEGVREQNQPKYWRELVEHMITTGVDSAGKETPGWVIHQPDFEGTPAEDVPYDKAKYVPVILELVGGWLINQCKLRDYSISPTISPGEVDANGEPATFQDTSSVRTEGPVAQTTVDGS